jgi:crossover junction endodeoxyribonuclease RusA
MSEYTFRVDSPPRSKGRPRMTRRGRVFTPKATTVAEGIIGDAYDGPLFEGSVIVHIDYDKDGQTITVAETSRKSKMRADIDNMVKATLDGLNGKAFNDDKQVVVLVATKN